MALRKKKETEAGEGRPEAAGSDPEAFERRPGTGAEAEPEAGAEARIAASADTDDVACQYEHVFGGQAVLEGVMMRGKHAWAVAVRRPSGGIARMSYPLESAGERHHWLKLPVVRGVVALYESLTLGIKALGIAANIGLEASEVAGTEVAGTEVTGAADAGAADADARGATAGSPAQGDAGAGERPEEKVFGWKELAGTVTVAVLFAVALFIVVPLVVVKHFEDTFSNAFVFNLVEGLIRIALFLLYIFAISFIPDLRRVFQYHGAEHKVIHAYEACGRPDAERAVPYPTMHPRCGTGFLLLVMVIAVFVFAIVGKPSLPWLVLSRIVGILFIVGISYEIGIKWLGRHPKLWISRIVLWPGLQLQRLTTREPSPDQLEVAAAALDEVIQMDATQLSLRQAAAET